MCQEHKEFEQNRVGHARLASNSRWFLKLASEGPPLDRRASPEDHSTDGRCSALETPPEPRSTNIAIFSARPSNTGVGLSLGVIHHAEITNPCGNHIVIGTTPQQRTRCKQTAQRTATMRWSPMQLCPLAAVCNALPLAFVRLLLYTVEERGSASLLAR